MAPKIKHLTRAREQTQAQAQKRQEELQRKCYGAEAEAQVPEQM